MLGQTGPGGKEMREQTTPEVDTSNPCKGCAMCGPKLKVIGSMGNPILVVSGPTTSHRIANNLPMSKNALDVVAHFFNKNGIHKNDLTYFSSIRCGFNHDEYTTKEKNLILKHCREWLVQVIDRMRPSLIVTMGAPATRATIGHQVKITKVRGQILEDPVHGIPVLPMLDPASVYKYPQHEAIFNADCQLIRRLIDTDYDLESVYDVEHGDYRVIDDLQFLVDMQPEFLSFDIETVGSRWYEDEASICTMQFCTEAGTAYCLPWDHPEAPRLTDHRKQELTDQLRNLLQNPDTSVFGQNNKFDRVWVQQHLGFDYRIDHDTIMLAALIDENMLTKNQDDLVKLYVPEMAGYADLFNQTHDKSRMDLVPLEDIVEYGCGDVDSNFRLLSEMLPIVQDDELLWRHYRHVSMPGINAFAHIEPRGMLIDMEALDDLEEVLDRDLKEKRQMLMQQVPRSILRKHLMENPGKPMGKVLSFTRAKFLLDILFQHKDGLCLTPKVFTKSTEKLRDDMKVPSVSTKDHLPFFFEDHPFVVDLAEYIKSERVLSANIRSLKEKYVHNGKIYPSYQLWVAVTGRSSCLHGDTPVHTRDGVKPARDVRVGDELWTHKGRWRRVTFLPDKPDAEMLDVYLSSGEVLTCTPDHIVLLESGEWTTLRLIIEAGVEYAEHSQKLCAEQKIDIAGCVSPQECTIDGPSLWKQMGIRLLGWDGVPDPSCVEEEALFLQDSNREGFRVTDSGVIGFVCNAPHRQLPEEHYTEQPTHDARIGAHTETRTLSDHFKGYSIEAIYCRGNSRVYDFSVEEDESYLACGVFSHNSSDPNGQNTPKRGKVAKAYRRIFIAPPGFVIIEADLSQAELRISADMANDRTMLDIYNSGGDIHLSTAMIVMGVSEEQFFLLSAEERALARFKAKAVNFGFIYGMGWRKFIVYAKTQYGVEFTESEARRVRVNFFNLYNALPTWHSRMREIARRDKQVRSYSGRVRHLPMIDSMDDGVASEAERQAINSPVQEFASSLGIMAMARMDYEIDPSYLALTGFVHDALYSLVPMEYLEWGAKTVKRYMETTDVASYFGRELKCPIVADVGFGRNASETYEMDNLSLDSPYDFSSLDLDFDLPEQRIPPNNGLRVDNHEYLKIFVD